MNDETVLPVDGLLLDDVDDDGAGAAPITEEPLLIN